MSLFKVNTQVRVHCLNVVSLNVHQCATGWLPPDVHNHRLSLTGVKSLMTSLYSWLFPSDTHPMMAVSSENFCIWRWSELYLRSDVYRLNRKGERTVPCGAPVLPQTHNHEATYTVVCWYVIWWSTQSAACPLQLCPASLTAVQGGWCWKHCKKTTTWPSQCSTLVPGAADDGVFYLVLKKEKSCFYKVSVK